MGMTADDLREQLSMVEVVERYGLHPDRAGFLHCPFHSGDHTASLKIYQKDFYCFGCHAHGDIFKFVMMMDGCDFKTAFKTLGGQSGRLSDAAIVRMRKRKREANKRKERLAKALAVFRYAVSELHSYKQIADALEPFSEIWCEIQNLLPKLEQNADIALSNYMEAINEGR